jgi:hypothetical protein
MKPDLKPAVGYPTVDLLLAFDPHLALQPAGAVMDDRAGAALAGLAMTNIDAVGLSRRDCPQLAAVAKYGRLPVGGSIALKTIALCSMEFRGLARTNTAPNSSGQRGIDISNILDFAHPIRFPSQKLQNIVGC